MQYKFILIFLLTVFVFSGYVTEDIKNPIENYSKNLQEEIYIDESEIEVFDIQSTDKISVTESKVEAWIIEIKYNEGNIDNIKDSLLNTLGSKKLSSSLLYIQSTLRGPLTVFI